jgi:hypothetical protein
MDGGWDDDDGFANGIIVDHSGPVLLAVDDGSNDGSGDNGTSGGSGGGCFIESVSPAPISPVWPISVLMVFLFLRPQRLGTAVIHMHKFLDLCSYSCCIESASNSEK